MHAHVLAIVAIIHIVDTYRISCILDTRRTRNMYQLAYVNYEHRGQPYWPTIRAVAHDFYLYMYTMYVYDRGMTTVGMTDTVRVYRDHRDTESIRVESVIRIRAVSTLYFSVLVPRNVFCGGYRQS